MKGYCNLMEHPVLLTDWHVKGEGVWFRLLEKNKMKHGIGVKKNLCMDLDRICGMCLGKMHPDLPRASQK